MKWIALKPEEIESYTLGNKYITQSIHAEEEWPNIMGAILKCLETAKKQGHQEFCFKSIRQKYNILMDVQKYEIEIIGFKKL